MRIHLPSSSSLPPSPHPPSIAKVTATVVTVAAIAIALWAGAQNNKGEALESNVAMLAASQDVSSSSSSNKLETSTVQYYGNSANNNTAFGFLAKPAEAGKHPGIVMIHEWWGLNDNIKQMARQMASQGYVVLAVDLFHGQVTSDSNQAQSLATNVKNNPEDAINNLKAAVAYLRNNSTLGVGKVGSLGWCFGGDWSMQLALKEKMDATGLYYGQPVTDPKALSVIKWPILGIYGSADQSISVQQVKAFKQALDSDGIQNEIYIYNGVGHAFANPSNPNYAPNETKDAWQKTLAFFNAHLKS
jgi:carboxymethylenebutenolidase